MDGLSLTGKDAIRARTTTVITSSTNNVLSRLPRKRTDLSQQLDDQDGPGQLSQAGPRHDNDHIDYRLIQILPTADEVLCTSRSQYMPKKNVQESHFLEPGPLRLLDTQFRHLRYDSTESIRDILYSAAQLGFINDDGVNESCNKSVLETGIGNRYHMYSGLCLEELISHERKGIIVRFSFECPSKLKGQLIHKSTRLETGMLCAVLLLNKVAQQMSIIYFDIHLRQSTETMKVRCGDNSRAAVQLAFHSNAAHDDVHQVMRLAHGLGTHTEIVLVEFPGVLYLSFFNALHRLQQIQPDEIAFRQYLAPEVVQGSLLVDDQVPSSIGTFVVPPPLYTNEPNFAYDLSPIAGRALSLPISSLKATSSRSTLELVTENSTLDEGQAVAMCNSLSRELVFTQGPPGTGKTFLGVALTRVLLASRHSGSNKPIIVVCLTNHALDSFLDGLREADVENLLRIGSASREDWTHAINLTQKSRSQRYTEEEHKDWRGVISQKSRSFDELSAWCNTIRAKLTTQQVSWLQIEVVLRKRFPDLRQQLVTAIDNVAAQTFTFDYWAGGGDISQLDDLHKELEHRLIATTQHQHSNRAVDARDQGDAQKLILETLRAISDYTSEQSSKAGADNLWQLPYQARQGLIADWSRCVDEDISASDLAYMHLHYQDLNTAERELRNKKDVRTLGKQDVIGLTTTGCASRWDLLRSLGPEILICEEAGEVMEAHVLCALLPSVKHAIFIGDPLQLRPQVNEQSMTVETSIGLKYRLDESLFERFMFPRDPDALIMPTSQLNIQRRMHPNIADITRLTYPLLRDHENTFSRPPVKGLSERIFWLDHRMPDMTDSEMSDSVFNFHEIELIRSMIRYLLRGSEYFIGDIAVLTPYTAQLSRLVESLQATCPIWLSESDKSMLMDTGQVDIELENVRAKIHVKMDQMLRCATIDNFQGEEAKIIILSTVRSGGKAGFMRTANRINVACSRARDGFFVIGNAETLSQVPMWKDIIDVFDRGSRRGPALRLQCPRHTDHNALAEKADDFENFASCPHKCGAALDCGHICHEACHDLDLHERMPCTESCDKVFECGHSCEKTCGELCNECSQSISEVKLDCGHVGFRLCSGKIPDCNQIVETRPLSCGLHTVEVICDQLNSRHICDNKCATVLQCGHLCSGICEQCKTTGAHQPCQDSCNKSLECGHMCSAPCHHDEDCPPCKKPCGHQCSHGRCRNACAEPCDPCTKTSIVSGDTNQQLDIICCLQEQDFTGLVNTFDRLLLKIAIQMNWFGYALDAESGMLAHGFKEWADRIRPNPLAANTNMHAIMDREKVLVELQDKIVTYRRTVVNDVQSSMAILHQQDPINIPEYLLLFHLRFDVLELRAVSIRFDDKFRIVSHLLSRRDPSQEMRRQANKILQFILTECLACINYCQAAVEDHHLSTSPCMEFEIRLHQVRLHLLACCAYRQLRCADVSLPASVAKIAESVLLASLERIQDVSKHYSAIYKTISDTCTRYRYLLTLGMNSVNTLLYAQVSPVPIGGGSRVEKSWAKHVLGHLAITCKHKHPYSTVTFPDGCPECGQWSEDEETLRKQANEKRDLEIKAANKHLFEDDFFAKMDKMSVTAPPSPSKTVMTPEEKFFAAMEEKFGR